MTQMSNCGSGTYQILIVTNARQLDGWQRVVLSRLQAMEGVDVAAIAHLKPEAARASGRGARALIENLERAVGRRLLDRFQRSKKIDVELFRAREIEPGDLQPTHLSLSSPEPSLEQIDMLRSLDLDVIINLTNRALSEPVHQLARQGCWSLCDERGGGSENVPLGYYAVCNNQSSCLVHLVQQSGPGKARRSLRPGRYGTTLWSWTMNQEILRHKAALLVQDEIASLTAGHSGGDNSSPQPEGTESRQPYDPENTQVGALRHVVTLARCAWRTVRDVIARALWEERWHVLLWRDEDETDDSSRAIHIASPAASYWADPFTVRQDGKLVVFFEEYLYAEKRGVISCAEIDEAPSADRPQTPQAQVIMSDQGHLSYPYILRHGNDLYMVPESNSKKTVELWKCERFPDQWNLVHRIMENVSAADSSILEHDGCYWMFTNIDRSGMRDHRNELHVFWSDSPLSKNWTAHPMNPVVVDVTRARMAGGFQRGPDGEIFRCCQVQGHSYGENTALHRIRCLDKNTYAEDEVGESAGLDMRGFRKHHHVSRNDGTVTADGCNYTSRLLRIYRDN